MRPLTSESFRGLLSERAAPCVSIYMPIARGPRAADQNRIRYAHVLSRVRAELSGKISPRDLDTLMESFKALDLPEFWAGGGAALAAFAARDFKAQFRLIDPVEELVIVASSFHVRPLIAQLQANRHFFLLTVSQKHSQLFRGSRLGLSPVEIGAPASLEDAIGVDQREHMVAQRSGATGGRTRGIFSGQGTGGAPAHEDLLRYFRAIDERLWAELKHENAPLVLACPLEYEPHFRAVSRYPHLATKFLHGNFEHSTVEQLHELAWPIAHEEAERNETRWIDEFGSFAAHGKGTSELSEIARFAVQGRVRELMLADGEHVWGNFDRATGALDIASPQAGPQGEDVLDDIAETVLQRGGHVLSLEKTRMPVRAGAAAILRW